MFDGTEIYICIASGRLSKKERMIKHDFLNKRPNITEPTNESHCGYKIDSDTGAMILIDILYEQGEINKATYDNIQKKYENKKNKKLEVSKHEK